MNVEKVLNISRISGIDPQKVRRALSLPQPNVYLRNLVSVRRRYELSSDKSTDERDSFETLLQLCEEEIEKACTVAEAKIAHELTPSASRLKIQSLAKWRLLAKQAIQGCSELVELQKLLFLIPPDTEEELQAIRKLTTLL